MTDRQNKRVITRWLDADEPATVTIEVCKECGADIGTKQMKECCTKKRKWGSRGIAPSNPKAKTNKDWLTEEKKRYDSLGQPVRIERSKDNPQLLRLERITI